MLHELVKVWRIKSIQLVVVLFDAAWEELLLNVVLEHWELEESLVELLFVHWLSIVGHRGVFEVLFVNQLEDISVLPLPLHEVSQVLAALSSFEAEQHFSSGIAVQDVFDHTVELESDLKHS